MTEILVWVFWIGVGLVLCGLANIAIDKAAQRRYDRAMRDAEKWVDEEVGWPSER